MDAFTDPIALPATWLFLAPLLLPYLVAAAVRPTPEDMAHLRVWEKRLRLAIAGLASVLLVLIEQTTSGTVTLGGVITGLAITFRGSGAVHDVLDHFGVDINARVAPERGIDPRAAERYTPLEPLGPTR